MPLPILDNTVYRGRKNRGEVFRYRRVVAVFPRPTAAQTSAELGLKVRLNHWVFYETLSGNYKWTEVGSFRRWTHDFASQEHFTGRKDVVTVPVRLIPQGAEKNFCFGLRHKRYGKNRRRSYTQIVAGGTEPRHAKQFIKNRSQEAFRVTKSLLRINYAHPDGYIKQQLSARDKVRIINAVMSIYKYGKRLNGVLDFDFPKLNRRFVECWQTKLTKRDIEINEFGLITKDERL